MRELGNDWENSVDIAIADSYGKVNPEKDVHLRYESFRERCKELLITQGGKTTVDRPINGHDLIAMGIKPGPKMGEIFKALDELLLEDPGMSKEAALNWVKSFLAQVSLISEEWTNCFWKSRS